MEEGLRLLDSEYESLSNILINGLVEDIELGLGIIKAKISSDPNSIHFARQVYDLCYLKLSKNSRIRAYALNSNSEFLIWVQHNYEKFWKLMYGVL